MEPESVNKLAEEAEDLRKDVLGLFNGNIPDKIKYLFGDTSFFFEEEIVAEWRRTERFEELVEYLLYQYEESGGEEICAQVLLDLRLKHNVKLAIKLLDGLCRIREEKFWIALKNYKKYPKNHFSKAALCKAKGILMSLLYEYAYILENRPIEQQDKELVESVKIRIDTVFNEQKIT